MEEKKQKKNPMEKIATFIVDKRNLFFLIYVAAFIFSIFAKSWVKVDNELTDYLPETTETRQGLDIMDKNFITYGTSRIMISNITYPQAEALVDQIEAVKGVDQVEFDDSEDHFKGTNALYSITYTDEAESDVSVQALDDIKSLLSDYDVSVEGEVGNDMSVTLAQEINVIMGIVIVIIIIVLLITSQTYAEIPVLLLTFGAAIILNQGTNFIFGEISFVSNSVCSILQLGLSIDYAIIMCHRFSEERENLEPREACITALSKAIIEISSSSLTTMSGLLAMMFMHFQIGFDLGRVLIKAVIFSMIVVFTLMPGLLMLFSKWIDRTHHRKFIPEINGWGKLITKIYPLLMPIFVVAIVFGCYFSNKCPYVFSQNNIDTLNQSETQLEEKKIKKTFGDTNIMALIVPSGHYDKEKAVLEKLETYDQVDYTTGLSNIEVSMDDEDEDGGSSKKSDTYMLTDSLTPRQFAEMTDMDIEQARMIYSAYAVDNEEYGHIINNLDGYGVPLLDMFLFAYDHLDYVNLDQDQVDDLNDLHDQLTKGQDQLQSEKYTRMLLSLNLPEEDQETFDFLSTIRQVAEEEYGEDAEIYLVGNSTSDYDLSNSFSQDNLMISILSALFVIIVLLFTFQSVGMPILLIIVIQGSIWINFSVPYLSGTPLFFLGYLVVSSIQMGANIDYAIVIANRYTELKKEMPIKEAIITTLNQAFPTIITSGAILATAGVLIALITTNPAIYGIGVCLGRGTIISMFLVMAILPAILILGDKILERTRFNIKYPERTHSVSGKVHVDGRVRGYISGQIDAEIHGVVDGDIDAMVDVKQIKKLDEEEDEEDDW